MTRMVAAVIALAMASTAGAASFRSIKVMKTDGTEIFVAGEKGLAAGFEGPEMTFVVGDRVMLSLPVAEVKRWDLSQESGVESLVTDRGLTIDYRGGNLTVTHIPDGSLLRIHSLSGTVQAEATASGSHTFDISGLQTGVYILTCNGKSIKLHIAQ